MGLKTRKVGEGDRVWPDHLPVKQSDRQMVRRGAQVFKFHCISHLFFPLTIEKISLSFYRFLGIPACSKILSV